jgi:septum formation protein
MPRLILGSNSPRRRELLRTAGYDFTVVVPAESAECGICTNTGPIDLVADLAHRKAVDVRDQLGSRWKSESLVIVSADTVAECDGLILGKPADEAHAREMLRRLRGREHRVYTGVCVWPSPPAIATALSEPKVRVAITSLVMEALPDADLDDYISSGKWQGKAGAFGYQDELGWIRIQEGSESNVVGLPMELLAEMLGDIEFRS